jgi:hypothetical protein
MGDNFPIFLAWNAFMCKITFISQLVNAHTAHTALHQPYTTTKFATLHTASDSATDYQAHKTNYG